MDSTYDFNLSMTNDGDPAAISNNKASSSRSRNFCYDSLNRIKLRTERVGHPEKLNPPLGVDAWEWYYPTE
jgi:hypothetical protein